MSNINDFEIENEMLKKYKGTEENVVIPDGITTIGKEAFSTCTELKSVTIPQGVTRICGWAFYGCSGLKKVVLPDSVTTIDSWAFYGCSKLSDITFHLGITSIGNEAFYGCNGLKNLIIPDSVTKIGNKAFIWCKQLESIKLSSALTNLGSEAFRGCKSLKSITLPQGLTKIGKEVFENCSSLAEVIIPDSVTSIDDEAFYGCTLLTDITIPDSVTSIAPKAFANCPSLTIHASDSSYAEEYAKQNGIKFVSTTQANPVATPAPKQSGGPKTIALNEIFTEELNRSILDAISAARPASKEDAKEPTPVSEKAPQTDTDELASEPTQDSQSDTEEQTEEPAPEAKEASEAAAETRAEKPSSTAKKTDTAASTASVDESAGFAFISYSSLNTEQAKKIREILNDAGIKTWIAPDDIPAGSNYPKAVNRAIKNCSCLVLILTDAAQNSVWVPKEVERALNYRKPLVTIQLEDVVLNDEFEMYISTSQLVRVSKIDKSTIEMKKVLESIKVYTSQKTDTKLPT